MPNRSRSRAISLLDRPLHRLIFIACTEVAQLCHHLRLLERRNGIGIPLAAVDQARIKALIRLVDRHIDHVRAQFVKDLAVGAHATHFDVRHVIGGADRCALAADVHRRCGEGADIDEAFVRQIGLDGYSGEDGIHHRSKFGQCWHLGKAAA